MKTRTLPTIALLLFAVFGMLLSPAWAGISVKPTVIEAVLEPGQSEEGTYEVTNVGEAPMNITVQLEDWMQRLFNQKDEMEVSQWLSVDPQDVTLEPGETAVLKYRIEAPQVFNNEKVAQVFFTFSEAANLTSRLGVIVYLSPKKEAKMAAEITQFMAQTDVREGKEPRLLSYFIIRNDSNLHIRPRGIVSILDQNQTRVREMLVDNVPGIYPGKSFTWNHYSDVKGLAPGTYTAHLTLDYGYLYGQEASMEKTAELRWEPVPQTAPAEGAAAL
ncbi:MAG: molecular chaperone [Candidatus Omnitrophica bacterium]|nr:molecular chaperone [Candidatus Omnitrophota bacterium]